MTSLIFFLVSLTGKSPLGRGMSHVSHCHYKTTLDDSICSISDGIPSRGERQTGDFGVISIFSYPGLILSSICDI